MVSSLVRRALRIDFLRMERSLRRENSFRHVAICGEIDQRSKGRGECILETSHALQLEITGEYLRCHSIHVVMCFRDAKRNAWHQIRPGGVRHDF